MRHTTGVSAFLVVLSFGCGSVPPVNPAAIIAVASDGDNAVSLISRSAERSPNFLIFADTGELLDVFHNPYSGEQGDVAQNVISFLRLNRVDLIVAARFSPEMIEAMKAWGLSYMRFEGVAQDAVDRAGVKPRKKKNNKGDNP